MAKVLNCINCEEPIEVKHFGNLEWCNDECLDEWKSKTPNWKSIFKTEIVLKMLELERLTIFSISDILTATEKGIFGSQGFYWTSFLNDKGEGKVTLKDIATNTILFESDPDTMCTLIEYLKNADVEVRETQGDESPCQK